MELARERYVVQEAGGLGLLDRLGAVARAQLLVDAHHMRLDRAAANAEPISDTPQRQYVASRGSTRSSAGVKLTGRWSGCGLPPVAIGCWALLFNLSPPMTGFLDHIG